MRTFAEWVAENHPEDEVLSEILRGLKDSGLGGAVRAGLTAGALMLGSGGSNDAGAAMPMVPNISSEEGASKKPFSREFILDLAKEMGASREKLEKMSDFDLWHWQQNKITRIERDMFRHNMAKMKGGHVGNKEWPMWYLKFGTYYEWKAPAPPKHPTEVK